MCTKVKQLCYGVLAGVLVLLVGCAASPKPVLPDGLYDQLAESAYGLEKCGLSGRMELSLVAAGKNMLIKTASKYTVDSQRMGTQINSYVAPVSDDWCKKTSISILQNKQNKEAQQATSVAPSSGPSFTNCNTYFGQTFCTHY